MRRSRKAKLKGKRKPSGLQPIRNTSTRIKRNGPCPCGSGKKVKNCCLRQIQMWESIPPARRAAIFTDAILGSAEKPVAQLAQVDQAAAEAMLPKANLQTSVGAAVEMMKGEAQ